LALPIQKIYHDMKDGLTNKLMVLLVLRNRPRGVLFYSKLCAIADHGTK